MALFQKGQNQKSPGRKGARNRLSTALLEALAKDFEEFGVEAVKITRIERPSEYLKIVAGILPKELEIVDNRLAEVSDDELDTFIELARQRRAAGSNTGSREDQTTH
jgi:UTP:GlnB (protein PII) uridylyltransferase